jgi:hypothetical protein
MRQESRNRKKERPVPTKYNREDFRDYVGDQHPHLRVSREPGPPVAKKMRKPGFMLVLTVTAIIVVLTLGSALGRMAAYYGQPVVEGSGVIADKTVENRGEPNAAYYVSVDISPDGNKTLQGEIQADEARWQDLIKGQRVTVEYQLSRSGEEIRIQKVYVPVIEPEEGDEADAAPGEEPAAVP